MPNQKVKTTIQDIANSVGVSKTTISRYLNGKYNYMSEETRKKIEETIAAVNFRPNKVAGSLKTAKSDLIGLVIPDAISTMTPYLISSICDQCALYGRKLIVVSTHEDEDREKELIQSLLDQQVDGILTATGSNIQFYAEVDQTVCPVILIDRVPIPEPPTLHTVSVDHYQGTANAVSSLLHQGVRRVVLLLRSSRNQYGTFALREQGARDACRPFAADGVSLEKVLVPDSQLHDVSAMESMLLRFAQESQNIPTAVFIVDGLLAIPVICHFFRIGLVLSDHLSLACYDIMHFAQTLSDRILTVDQPLIEMGSLSAEMLVQRIAGTMQSDVKHHYLTCTLSNI